MQFIYFCPLNYSVECENKGVGRAVAFGCRRLLPGLAFQVGHCEIPIVAALAHPSERLLRAARK